ncbi:MAG: hypothetical protein GX279_01455 [Clostridiaceae bacterium]|nr:hypothetical protein [Clostridiaceae bacterium]
MDFTELVILIFSGYHTVKNMRDWYRRLPGIGPVRRDKTIKYVLGLLPVVSFFIIIYTLKVLASFDVVNDLLYIIFYVLLGYAWAFLGMKAVFIFFDISWIDDVLNLNNKAALYAVSGAFIGLVTIYSGANIGDGPGWWCVIFAGGLGLISWVLLARLINSFAQVFERITTDRDIYCGVRFGAYLLASGIILARASAGDWTSFYSTIIEFLVGWPVLPLTALAIIIERYYIHKAKLNESITNTYLFGSLYWSAVYLAFAVASVLMFPFVENPIYGIVSAVLPGAVL